ncbi:hypothetical protein EVAR_57928_1 [Eumeta japonica]|uniref:Uncharacterized protein n=1 Tax=Eumeta variegata TaxID=151549 RepID=A0A4C1ZLP8_EUMVA|nr:hypothetical protein EVAR_57928_1 [Eumeta japonica]
MAGREPGRFVWYGCETVYRAHVALLGQICEMHGNDLSYEPNACSSQVQVYAPFINCGNFDASVPSLSGPLPRLDDKMGPTRVGIPVTSCAEGTALKDPPQCKSRAISTPVCCPAASGNRLLNRLPANSFAEPTMFHFLVFHLWHIFSGFQPHTIRAHGRAGVFYVIFTSSSSQKEKKSASVAVVLRPPHVNLVL